MKGVFSKLAKFLIVFTLLLVVLWFALPSILKPKLESFASETHGAQVDISGLDLSMFPPGIRLDLVEVTDKSEPTTNQQSVGVIDFKLSLLELFSGNIIIPLAKVSGIKFGTERSSPGFVLQSDASEKEDLEQSNNPLSDYFESIKEMGDLSNFSAEKLLEKEPLKSVEFAESIEAKFKASKESLESIKDDLPDKDRLKELEDEIKSITEGKIKNLEDFQARKAKLDDVLKEAKGYKEKVAQAKTIATDSVSNLGSDLSSIKSLADEDIAYLKDKYSLDVSGLSNLTSLLFQEAAGDWLRKMYGLYQFVEPYLGSNGQDSPQVSVNEEAEDSSANDSEDLITPDFWIQKLKVKNFEQDGLKLGFEATDITHQQDRVGKPARIKVDGTQDSSRFDLSGVISRLGGSVKDEFSWNIGNWPLGTIDLGLDGALIESSSLLTKGSLTRDFESIAGSFSGELLNLIFNGADTENSESIGAQFLSEALSSVKSVDFNGGVEGSLSSPALSLSSNLDKQLSISLEKQLSSSNSVVNKAITEAVSERIAGSESLIKEYGGFLEDENLSLADLEGGLDGLLKSKLSSFEDQAKDKLEDKLKKKLKKLF